MTKMIVMGRMSPCTEIRGEEKVRLRPDHEHGEHGEQGEHGEHDEQDEGGNDDDAEDDGEQYDGEDKSDGMEYLPVRLLLNAWLVP